ncbi:MAG: hypothetical protein Q9208_005273 [Pyrenodesmia sp. 3 TL-2023]
MDIPGSDELSITIEHYGRFAPEARWIGIREALNDFERRFAEDGEDYWVHLGLDSEFVLCSGVVSLRIFDVRTSALLPKECPRILKTINDLFFVFRDNPREIKFSIHRNRILMGSFNMEWKDAPALWPQLLPWKIDPPAFPNSEMFVFLYGRDYVYKARNFDRRFDFDFSEAAGKVPDVVPKSGTSVTSGMVRVDIEPLSNTELLIPAVYLRHILSSIHSHTITAMNLRPRDFGVYVKLAQYPGVKVLITVMFREPPTLQTAME